MKLATFTLAISTAIITLVTSASAFADDSKALVTNDFRQKVIDICSNTDVIAELLATTDLENLKPANAEMKKFNKLQNTRSELKTILTQHLSHVGDYINAQVSKDESMVELHSRLRAEVTLPFYVKVSGNTPYLELNLNCNDPNPFFAAIEAGTQSYKLLFAIDYYMELRESIAVNSVRLKKIEDITYKVIMNAQP